MRVLHDKKRNRFFLSHLLLSLLVISVFLAVVFFVWYPYPLAMAMGVLPILGLMVAIDVFVGPIFGFLVYKTGKKTLKMDLAIIVLIQLVAFAVGAYSVAKARPAWIVHHGNTFSVVRHIDVLQPNAEVSWLGPNWVSYQSQNPLQEAFTGEGDIFNPRFYAPLSQVTGLPLSYLQQYNDKEKVAQVLAKYPTADTWLGLSTTGVYDVVVLIDEQKQVVAIENLRPWN